MTSPTWASIVIAASAGGHSVANAVNRLHAHEGKTWRGSSSDPVVESVAVNLIKQGNGYVVINAGGMSDGGQKGGYAMVQMATDDSVD